MSHQDHYETNIYVLNADGSPLMPCHSQRKVRRWIKEGKATVACEMPYTVQLTQQLEDPQLQPVILGEDPGPNNIGIHAIDEQGRSLVAADVETDNRNVTKHMGERREHRHVSRRGERKRRQRRQTKVNARSGKIIYQRKLPQCAEPIDCHVIRNSLARFCNRARPEGWLSPTARNLVETHVNLVCKIAGFLPVSMVAIEENKFDFTRLKMLDPKTWDALVAPLVGYGSAHEYVDAMQGGKCLLCDNGIEHYHHIVPRKKNGADTVGNLAGLCTTCHDKVHKDKNVELSLLSLISGLEKKYGRISILNQAVPFIISELAKKYPIRIIDAADTKRVREKFSLSKSSGKSGHYIDAWCIATCALDSMDVIDAAHVSDKTLSLSCHVVRQFRRHDRALIHAQKERTYKDASGKTVAKNRHKRIGQLDDSLEEYRAKRGDAAVSGLSVRKSRRSYKDPRRVLPGAVFYDEGGHRHVLTGAKNKNTVFLSNGESFGKSKVRIVRRNEGLVFMS